MYVPLLNDTLRAVKIKTLSKTKNVYHCLGFSKSVLTSLASGEDHMVHVRDGVGSLYKSLRTMAVDGEHLTSEKYKPKSNI